jgi:glycosyltransferase involved in cell wall biosynthesis
MNIQTAMGKARYASERTRDAAAPQAKPAKDAFRKAAAMASSVLVTHPGLQHSHQLALALHEKRLLQAFWSGIPVAANDEPLPWWLPAQYQQRIRRVDIPVDMRMHPLRFQVLLKASSKLRFGFGGDRIHRIFHRFDAWAAEQVLKLRPAAVVAYENAAYHTFAAARAIGARCILDAAAFHHATVSEQMQVANTPYTGEVNRRKDAEIAMADLILTCSPIAAQSYAINGVDSSRLQPLLLGADPMACMPRISTRSPGPLRFIFAGPMSRRKSVDLILAAFNRLHAASFAYELNFVGGVVERDLLNAVHQTPNARHHPSVPQAKLFALMAEADCLLLPSRSDSFGMVVAEAMSCGTPALISSQTGAKAIIEAFPGSGWIVEPELESLHAALAQLIQHPEFFLQAREPALQASKEFSWAAYRRRAGMLLEDFLQ